jgi:hypothetical protein
MTNGVTFATRKVRGINRTGVAVDHPRGGYTGCLYPFVASTPRMFIN